MQNNYSTICTEISRQLGDQHATIYRLIAKEDQVMSTFGLECATNMSSDNLAECLGDLVRGSYIQVFTKHNRPPAWETVKEIAQAS